MKSFLGLGIVAVVVAASCWACLVHSGCLNDDDCESPERCFSDGACRLECSEDSVDYCTASRPLCRLPEHRCVACLTSEDCSNNEECVSTECVPGVAPDFTLVDRNPDSATFGQSIALADSRGQVVLIFFAGLG